MVKWAVLALILGAGTAQAATEKAIVAGAAFGAWNPDFESVDGVKSVVSGYTGGTTKNPTYKQVGKGGTGHYEAVEITFDNAKVSYGKIIELFFRSVDPTDPGGQFCDRGDSYRTAVFPLTAAQMQVAEAEKAKAEAALRRKIVTPIVAAGPFYKAEAYHQDYYKGSNIVITRRGPKAQSDAYDFYRQACGRDARVKQLWGKAAVFAH